MRVSLPSCVRSLLFDQDVGNAVNLCELLTVQRGEQLSLTSQVRNKLLCQGDGRQTAHVTLGQKEDLHQCQIP